MSMFITQIFYPLGYLLNEFLIYIISCFTLARMQKNKQYQIFIHTREYLFEYFCYICKVSEILIAEIMLTLHLNNSA